MENSTEKYNKQTTRYGLGPRVVDGSNAESIVSINAPNCHGAAEKFYNQFCLNVNYCNILLAARFPSAKILSIFGSRHCFLSAHLQDFSHGLLFQSVFPGRKIDHGKVSKIPLHLYELSRMHQQVFPPAN